MRGIDDFGPPANPHHIREWSGIEFARRLASAGFRILRFGHTRNNDRDGVLAATTSVVTGDRGSAEVRKRVVQARDLDIIRNNIPAHLLDRQILSETSILIKTFERSACVARLIDSIRAYYPDIRILVADDSREPSPLEEADYDRFISRPTSHSGHIIA